LANVADFVALYSRRREATNPDGSPQFRAKHSGSAGSLSDGQRSLFVRFCERVFAPAVNPADRGNCTSGAADFIRPGTSWRLLAEEAEHQDDAYFLLLFVMMAVVGVLAHLVNLPGIVGAFLAGLAINAAVP